ncbi:MAG: hypothetical protein ACT4P6_01015 [Gemmatimonadaceae bacterium]
MTRSSAFRRVTVLLTAIACGDRTAQTDDTLGATAAAAALPTGEKRVAVPDGNIWYKLSGTGTGAPLILLHGGPGCASF